MPNYDLKIVAFGDSLTAPTYTIELGRLVRTEGGVPNASVVQRGYLGAITCQLEDLFEVNVLQERPHAVVLLGGTNDLGYAVQNFLGSEDIIQAFLQAFYKKYTKSGMAIEKLQELANISLNEVKHSIVDSLEPEVIVNFFGLYVAHTLEHLVFMYERAQKQGISPIAVAVPSVKTDYFRALTVPPRVALNTLIKRYCAKHSIPYVDLFNGTADQKTGLMLPQYSGDGLHFNDAGYKEMARIVFEQGVKPTMQKLTQI